LALEPRFDDCGFLIVKMNKRFLITDHGVKLWGTNLKLTVFSFHKILLTAGMLMAVIFDLK
jgi:hypothetical protein